MAPPFGFTRAGSRPSSWFTASACAAKASFDSITSKSPAASPVRASSACTAGTGPMPITSGRTPATAWPSSRNAGVSPAARAASPRASTSAAAPSLIPEALPAVTVPSRWNTALRPASFSSEVSLGCSSVSKATTPLRVLISMGTIWSRNRPSAMAAAARRCDSSANSSCARREMPCSRATFSAVTPMWPVPIGQVSAPVIMSSIGASPILTPKRAAGMA